MFGFRMNIICDNLRASKDERFSETGRETDKDIVAQKNSHRFPLLGKIVR